VVFHLITPRFFIPRVQIWNFLVRKFLHLLRNSDLFNPVSHFVHNVAHIAKAATHQSHRRAVRIEVSFSSNEINGDIWVCSQKERLPLAEFSYCGGNLLGDSGDACHTISGNDFSV